MRAQFKRNSGFENKKPQVGGRREGYKLTDHVEMYEWPKGGASGQARIIGPIESRGLHKIKVKKKDGSETEITKVCLAFDPATDELDSTKKCPYCKLPKDLARFQKGYFFNVIDRRLEEEAPKKQPPLTAGEKKTGFKEIDSKSWTPARVMRQPSTGATRLQSLGAKNLVKSKTGDKKKFPVNHDKYGFDLDMSFDKSKPPANMYEIDRNQDERFTPLTEEQKEYLLWDIESIYPPESLEDAKKEAASLLERFGGGEDEEGDDDDDDDDDKPSKKSSKKPVKKTRASKDDDDEEDDEEDEDDEDLELDEDDEDEEDEKPAKKSSKKPSKKSSKDDDDEEEEDEEEDEEDDEEEEEEEDEKPSKKSAKKPAKKPAKKTRASKDDDDDEDEEDDLDDLEDDEDEEEEDEKPAKKSTKKPAKKTAPAKKPAKKTR